MAIENRFASEEYVLNELQNYENTHTPDWMETDPESDSYIKNKTHYKNLITLTWDGNEEGHDVYVLPTDPSNKGYIKYIKILDTVPCSKEDASIVGVCKYSYNDTVEYDSSNISNPTRFMISSKYQHGKFDVKKSAEIVSIEFYDGSVPGYTRARVLFCFSEGTVSQDGNYDPITLPIGVYFVSTTQSYSVTTPVKTLEYSFYQTQRLNDNLLSRNLVNYSNNLNGINNEILFSYSTAQGNDNYIGPYYTNTVLTSLNSPSDQIENYITYDTSSHVEGSSNQVFSKRSHAEGNSNQLSIPDSHIEGRLNIGGDKTQATQTGAGCHIEGSGNTLSGSEGGHIEGRGNRAAGEGVHAEGVLTQATTDAAHAQNRETIASAYCSSASGLGSKATASMADAGGSHTEANHIAAFTRGQSTISGRNYQTVIGKYNEIFDDSLFDVGNGEDKTTRKTAFSVKQDGSAKLQTQGTTEDSITRKDYVDNTIKNVTDETAKNILSITSRIESWETVQKIVRLGYAPYIFKIGDQLTCNHETFGSLVWDIIDFDHDIPNDQEKTHSMTLQLHNVLDTNMRGFDCAEALFQVQEDLEPGNYYLSYNAKIDNSGTTSVLMFTIPQGTTIPAGSLCVNASTTGTGTSWIFIPDAFSKDTILCTVTMKVATLQSANLTGYTSLGFCNYYRASGNGTGNGAYINSSIRQFLNSDEELFTWHSTHSIDMPPTYHQTEAGFLYGLDTDFKNVIGEVNKTTFNTLSQQYENSIDLIFLPSTSEVYGAVAIDLNGNIIEEEAPYAYYKLNSSLTAPGTGADINKIKYDSSNTARRYYLRSCGATSSTASTGQAVNTSKVFVVNPTGNITNMPVNQTAALTSASFLAPCCCIV